MSNQDSTGTTAAHDASLVIEPTDRKGLAVLAARPFAQGECVVVGRPVEVVLQRTQHSFQKDWDLHVDLDAPARYMNHSCEPNTGVVDNEFGGYSFVALRDIDMGEELTWDYETTEYESISVRVCLCGSVRCRGEIEGYGYRDPHAYAPRFTAGYLRVAHTGGTA